MNGARFAAVVRVWLPALLLALPVVAPAAPEQIDLRPGEPVPVGLHSVFQGLASLLGRWSYWQGERVVEIETVPADAQLALYYIRRNFQKRYESAQAPVRVRLPKRVNTTSHDTLSIRVLAAGYTTVEHKYSVRDVPEKLSIRLAPLPNALIDIVHTYIAGRTTLSLHTTESPEFRISRSRGAASLVLALTKTANKLGPGPRIQGGPLRELEVTQVGEDILLRLSLDSASLEIRSRQHYDAIREEHVFQLDMISEGHPVPTTEGIRREFRRLAHRPQATCHRRVEAVLRDALDPARVARTFRPSGGLVDLYRREAMRELGRADRGRVHTQAGEELRTGHPIELEMALRAAASVEGYLGLLAHFARRQPESELVLRSLLAPSLEAAEFATVWSRGEEAWTACRARARQAVGRRSERPGS